jgi:hypothetical protein
MIISTILPNLIGIYEISDQERMEINDYKQRSLYNEEYRKCARIHHSTKIFGEPLQCVDDAFLVSSLDRIGAQTISTDSPDLIHLKRTMGADNDKVVSVDILSAKSGMVLMIEGVLDSNTSVDEMREIATRISKTHGQPDVTPPNPQMPMWGWITNDGYDIRLFLDRITRQKKVSITHKNAYEFLTQPKTK